jgi:hypothetical protein
MTMSRRELASIWQFRSSSRVTRSSRASSHLSDNDLAKLHDDVAEKVGRFQSLGRRCD